MILQYLICCHLTLIFQHVKDFEDLVRTVVTLCTGEEQERLREMEDWIVKGEVGEWILGDNSSHLLQGCWVLGEEFNTFLGHVLLGREVPSEARVNMMKLLAYGAKEDDMVLILHMDR